MTRALILVTGSRALADTPAATIWAKGVLRAAIGALPLDGVVCAGDASGPDLYALTLARRMKLATISFRLDGVRVVSGEPAQRWYHDPDDTAEARFGRRWPLVRNERMVDEVALWARLWCVASVVAVHAPWARTHGTAHTVTLARKAELAVVEHTCPLEHAPR